MDNHLAVVTRTPCKQLGVAPCRSVDLQAGRNLAVPVVGESAAEVRSQWQAASTAGADLVEWRLDFFAEDSAQIEPLGQELRRQHELPVLATWRSDREGGNLPTGAGGSPSELFAGAEGYAERVLAASRWADAVDVELALAQAWPGGDLIAAVHGTAELPQERGRESLSESERKSSVKGKRGDSPERTQVLLHPLVVASHHEFNVPPVGAAQLITVLQKMAETGADVLKIAWMVNTPEELQYVLMAQAWAQKNLPHPCALIAMGEVGAASRLGEAGATAAFTFAVATDASAPGQKTVAEVKSSWN